ncbi:secretion protein EspE [Mycobacterium uberis]|uniref:Secretion protein EspE n=1 Tax=Mycobacterium uberis TaxID=2162698 RepID=A0A3E1HL70_9MYCO|nr:EspA/EspE family type VII secretion system effector [Mycobacterium uberis]RFD27188.1 secretion protein EspE [Mycobacterium uberis]
MSGTGICDSTIGTISSLLLLLGEGIPDPGDIFQAPSSMFTSIATEIGKAVPGLDWVGKAADAYSVQNLANQLRTQTMSQLDKLTNNFVSNQAKYVSNTRDVLNAMKNMVQGVRKACASLQIVWLIGDALSYAIAIPACGLAMAVVGGAMLYLTIMTLANTTNLQGVLGNLLDMITSLPKDLLNFIPGLIDRIGGLIPNIPGIWPPNFNIPDWSDWIPKFPEFKWPNLPGLSDFEFPSSLIPGFPGLPGLPSLPDLFPGLPSLPDLFGNIGKLPLWGDFTKLPDFLGGILGMPSLSFSSLIPLNQLPAMSQLAATLGQLAQLTGSGGSVQLAQTAGSQAGSLISQTSQGGQQQGALVSDVKKDDEEKGASTGTAGAERAPIQTTGGDTTGETGGHLTYDTVSNLTPNGLKP